MGILLPTHGQLSWHIPLNNALSELADSNFTPDDHGLLAWSYPVSQCSTSAVPTSGTVRMVRLPVLPQGFTITSLACHINVAPTTPTAGQNFMGLYDSAGTRVAVTADCTTAFSTIGDKMIPLTGTYAAAAGLYWVAILANAATPPAFSACAALSATAANFNQSIANASYTNGPTSQTSLPASITMGSRTLSLNATWAGVL